MRGRPSVRLVGLLLVIAAVALVAGCETEDRQEALQYSQLLAAGDADAAEASDLFHVDATLYRRYSGDTWRLDKDLIFTIKDESHVKAEVELRNLRPRRTYSIHLAWIRPDGNEMYRRYAEITRHEVTLPMGMVPDSTGALPASFTAKLVRSFGEKRTAKIVERLVADPKTAVPVTEMVYKKAIDLGYASRSLSLDDEPTAAVESRFNISREKERETGTYLLRIYLDRRLLQEIPFTLQDND